MSTRGARLRVNGTDHLVEVDPRTHLADVLRHDLGLTGTHVACEQGACGSCTVIVDGRAVRSCLMLAVQAEGAEVETVESLAGFRDPLHPVQQAIWEHHGMQCGFCTPGIVMSVVAAARDGVSTEVAIDEVLGAHLCRCTGYVNIRAAVTAVFSETAVAMLPAAVAGAAEVANTGEKT